MKIQFYVIEMFDYYYLICDLEWRNDLSLHLDKFHFFVKSLIKFHILSHGHIGEVRKCDQSCPSVWKQKDLSSGKKTDQTLPALFCNIRLKSDFKVPRYSQSEDKVVINLVAKFHGVISKQTLTVSQSWNMNFQKFLNFIF